MALIKCSKCGEEISDRAVKCPNCGADIVKAKLSFVTTLIDYNSIPAKGGLHLFIDKETGVNYFISTREEDIEDEKIITAICPRYDKNRNIFVTDI